MKKNAYTQIFRFDQALQKAVFAVVFFIFSGLVNPFTTQAQFGGGQGTETDPYLVETLEHLDNIRDHLDAHFLQTAIIDASETADWDGGSGWEPIGNETTTFTGVFDGDEYAIENLVIDRPATNYVGLFGHTDGAELKNVSLVNVDITGNDRSGTLVGNNDLTDLTNCSATGVVHGQGNWAGGLTGWNSGAILQCYTSVDVTGNNSVGGITGFTFDDSSILQSHSTGNVNGNWYVGGIVGFARLCDIEDTYALGMIHGVNHVGGIAGRSWNTHLKRCFALGDVVGSGTNAGGLVGELITNSSIENCFARGNVSGNDDVGGLVGWLNNSSVTNAYSTGSVSAFENAGGLIGDVNSPTITNSYWDIETSDQTESAGGEGRTTEEMTYPYAANTYEGWDFDDIWNEDEDHGMNDGYPFLIELVQELYDVTFLIEDPDGNEILHAIVTLGEMVNDEGDYYFENVPAGQYTYSVIAEGYQDEGGEVNVVDDITVEVILQAIPETFTVTFDVKDEDEQPITDAVVTFNGIENEPGNYVFEEVEEGTYSYLVEKEGYHTAEGEATIEDDKTIEIVLTEIPEDTFTVTFDVKDQDGESIENAVITFDGTTYDAGHYVFEDIAEGTYAYEVEKEGYHTVEDEVEVNDDVTVEVVMEMIVSVDDPETLAPMIYPNPASERLFVEAGKEVSRLRILNLSGQVVYEVHNPDQHHEINVSGLIPGVYLIEVSAEEGIRTQKVQISR